MSEYYFALPPQDLHDKLFPGVFPARVIFSGTLFALGVILILYKGFSTAEDWLLNLAGFFALGIAIYPMWWKDGYDKTFPYAALYHKVGYGHYVFAFGLFASMACVAFFCQDQSLTVLPENARLSRRWFKCLYKAIGAAMAIYLILAIGWYLLNHWYLLNDGWPGHSLYVVECVGVEIFATYWLLKSYEMEVSRADRKALVGRR